VSERNCSAPTCSGSARRRPTRSVPSARDRQGLNYDDLLLQTRLNGEVVQSQRTRDLIFGVAAIVSYVSRFVTLVPGDVIYTGTPGSTKAMKAGDIVEVELEGVGCCATASRLPRRADFGGVAQDARGLFSRRASMGRDGHRGRHAGDPGDRSGTGFPR